MSAEQITALINLGAAAAVIIVVVYFLRFIEKRDRDWQMFFQALLENKNTQLVELTQAVRDLLSEFRTHDTWERTKLDELGRKTQPRKPRNYE